MLSLGISSLSPVVPIDRFQANDVRSAGAMRSVKRMRFWDSPGRSAQGAIEAWGSSHVPDFLRGSYKPEICMRVGGGSRQRHFRGDASPRSQRKTVGEVGRSLSVGHRATRLRKLRQMSAWQDSPFPRTVRSDHVLPITSLPLRVHLGARGISARIASRPRARLPQFRKYCCGAARDRPADAGFAGQIGYRQASVRPGCVPRGG